ncbi:hypothetical protein H2203_008818 [Taxawa tesnikishii (nom. ined.)]|nr:hypothetical protein H2203_008818 [Dothideales sp. JES 119]
MAIKKMTANPLAAPRYRPGKPAAGYESPSESEESESEDEQQVAKAPAPKASSFPKTAPRSSAADVEARRVAAAAARAKEEVAKRNEEEGFVTASEDEEGEAEEEDESEEEESEEESEDDEQPRRQWTAPVFVSKAQRKAQTAAPGPSAEHLAAQEEQRRKEKADELLQAQLEKEAAERAASKKQWDDDDQAIADDVDDTDDVDPEAERAAWKLRELKRIKREREAIEEAEKEREEVERRRNLSVAEREAEDREHIEKQKAEREGKGQMGFMQKYYHKGAFFQGEGGEIEEAAKRRDIMGARYADDAANRELLPQYMQIRDMTKLGRKGRTKYKDMKSEDTGRWGDYGEKRGGGGEGMAEMGTEMIVKVRQARTRLVLGKGDDGMMIEATIGMARGHVMIGEILNRPIALDQELDHHRVRIQKKRFPWIKQRQMLLERTTTIAKASKLAKAQILPYFSPMSSSALATQEAARRNASKRFRHNVDHECSTSSANESNKLWETTRSHIFSLSRRWTQADHSQHVSGFEIDCHDLWYAFTQAAKHTDAEDPAQHRLVDQVIYARELGRLCRLCDGRIAETSDGVMWKDLPFLAKDLKEAWRGSSSWDFDQRKNLAAFVARLIGLGRGRWSGMTDWHDSRSPQSGSDGLTDKQTSGLLTLLIIFLHHARHKLVLQLENWSVGPPTFRNDGRYDFGELAVEPDLKDANFGRSLWRFWRSGLLLLADAEISPDGDLDSDVCEKAKRAAHLMWTAGLEVPSVLHEKEDPECPFLN